MKLHQDVALFGFIWMMIRRLRRVDRLVDVETPRAPGTRARPGGNVAAGVSLAVMGRAANLGGEIRHPEILAARRSRGARRAIRIDS